MKINSIITAVAALFLLAPSTAGAQNRRKAAKKAPVTVVQPTKEELRFANLLPSTAKVMFVDSIVVDKADMPKHIALSHSSGSLHMEKKDSLYNYAYTNEFGNRRYLSIVGNDGNHSLYVQDKLGRDWSEPEKVELQGDFSDIICPYLMPDGVTLYFAAKGGEDNIGKHDLFFTVYDSDNNAFYRPQSLGLPYNSFSEDYYYVIDDFENIGYLATDRFQADGKVCIYTFVPTESRETYDIAATSESDLTHLATLSSIALTQQDKSALTEAKQRLEHLRTGASASNCTSSEGKSSAESIHFVLNGQKTYTHLSQFKSESNKEKYMLFSSRKRDLEKKEAHLLSLRADFHKGKRSVADRIIQMENEIQTERIALEKMEKQIRNAELMR